MLGALVDHYDLRNRASAAASPASRSQCAASRIRYSALAFRGMGADIQVVKLFIVRYPIQRRSIPPRTATALRQVNRLPQSCSCWILAVI